MLERYSTPVPERTRATARARLSRGPEPGSATSLPSEDPDRDGAEHDGEDRHPGQRGELRSRPEPGVLEALHAGRGEVADPDQDVGQIDPRQVDPAEEHHDEEHRDRDR